jgi:hypothetical protein
MPRHLVDKLREVDRLAGNHDLGQTLAESCGWHMEELTDPKSEAIIGFIEDKRWQSRPACEKAKAPIAAELKDWPIEIEKGEGGWRIRVFWSERWHSLWKYCQEEGLDYDEAYEGTTKARWAV